MAIRVYVGTTNGPVQIERITREAAPQSAICLRRTTRQAAISGGYDSFVRQPSGVIEREFGPFPPGAFRLDVSADISDGDSWQLGVFAAHALAAQGLLAGPDTDPDGAVWLTGVVSNDLMIEPVTLVPDKLRASRDEFARLAAAGVRVRVFIPADNLHAAQSVDLPPEITVSPAGTTDDVCDSLELGKTVTTASPADDRVDGTVVAARRPAAARSARTRATRRSVVMIAALSVLAAAAVAGGLMYAGLKIERSDGPAPAEGRADGSFDRGGAYAAGHGVRITIYERRPPDGSTCPAVHFGRVEPKRIEVPLSSARIFATSRHAGLCGLEFAVSVSGKPVYVAAAVVVTEGRYVKGSPVPISLSGEARFSGRATWRVELARRMREPLRYRLIAASADRPVAETTRELRASADWQRTISRLSERGINVIAVQHMVAP